MKEDDSESSSDSDEYQDVPDLPGEKKESGDANNDENDNSDEESDINSDEESDDHVKANEESNSDHEKSEGTKTEDVDDVIEEGRLFIRNLPYSCTEEEIKAHVSQFGEVTDVFIPLNAKRESKGYCFVTFMFPEQAIKALEVGMESSEHRRS